jgi:hypothetical protein
MGAETLTEITEVCPGATFIKDGPDGFVHLPSLKIPTGKEFIVRDALLSLNAHSGYASRLFLSAPIPNRGNNWTVHTIMGRTWHTPSWKDVLPGRPIEMLLQHFGAYR